MAYGKWDLTIEEEKYFISLFKYMIDELTCGRKNEFDLSGKGINPAQIKKIMNQFGYEIGKVRNGFNEDKKIYYDKKNCNKENQTFYFEKTGLYFYYSGQTFEISLGIEK